MNGTQMSKRRGMSLWWVLLSLLLRARILNGKRQRGRGGETFKLRMLRTPRGRPPVTGPQTCLALTLARVPANASVGVLSAGCKENNQFKGEIEGECEMGIARPSTPRIDQFRVRPHG